MEGSLLEEGRGVLPQASKGERQDVRTRERHYARGVGGCNAELNIKNGSGGTAAVPEGQR